MVRIKVDMGLKRGRENSDQPDDASQIAKKMHARVGSSLAMWYGCMESHCQACGTAKYTVKDMLVISLNTLATN